jgi:hypothetical protein
MLEPVPEDISAVSTNLQEKWLNRETWWTKSTICACSSVPASGGSVFPDLRLSFTLFELRFDKSMKGEGKMARSEEVTGFARPAVHHSAQNRRAREEIL